MEVFSGYQARRVLVTGGAGAIGGNLCRRLADLGAEVAAIDDMSAAEEWNSPRHRNVRLLQGDITDPAALKSAFSSRPQVVFHLAALFANQRSVDDPETDLRTNGLGTLRVLQSASSVEARVVFASSGCTYGLDSPRPLQESLLKMGPTTPYQITKLLGEMYCLYFQQRVSLPAVRMRLFSSYGPGDVPGVYRNVIPNFIYRALKGLPLAIKGSGHETRCFTYVDDIVDGFLLAGVKDGALGQEINLASGEEVSILNLAEIVNAVAENRAGIQISERRQWDVFTSNTPSVERARAVLGFQAKTSLKQGVEKTVAWFRANWQRIEESVERRDLPAGSRTVVARH